MNREMILRVADAIEAAAKPDAKPSIGFNMESFVNEAASEFEPDQTGHQCGTTACIAGWAMHLSGDDLSRVEYLTSNGCIRRGAAILGLDFDDADDLFTVCDDSLSLEEITPSQAVSVLRHLAETGDVDWSIAERGVVA